MLFFMVGIAWFLIVVGGSIFTLGFIWMSEEYKNHVHFVSGIMGSITNPNNIEKATEIITKIYWYTLPIGASIIFIGLAISIFRFNQDSIFKKIRKRKMISFIVFASLFTIAAIVAGIFLVSGAQ